MGEKYVVLRGGDEKEARKKKVRKKRTGLCAGGQNKQTKWRGNFLVGFFIFSRKCPSNFRNVRDGKKERKEKTKFQQRLREKGAQIQVSKEKEKEKEKKH